MLFEFFLPNQLFFELSLTIPDFKKRDHVESFQKQSNKSTAIQRTKSSFLTSTTYSRKASARKSENSFGSGPIDSQIKYAWTVNIWINTLIAIKTKVGRWKQSSLSPFTFFYSSYIEDNSPILKKSEVWKMNLIDLAALDRWKYIINSSFSRENHKITFK